MKKGKYYILLLPNNKATYTYLTPDKYSYDEPFNSLADLDQLEDLKYEKLNSSTAFNVEVTGRFNFHIIKGYYKLSGLLKACKISGLKVVKRRLKNSKANSFVRNILKHSKGVKKISFLTDDSGAKKVYDILKKYPYKTHAINYGNTELCEITVEA